MTQETIASLVPIILTLFIGLILGGVIGGVIGNSLQNPGQPSKTPANSNLRHVVGLWRDKRNGRLTVEMQEKYFASLEKLPSAQVSALIQALNDLQLWLNVDNINNRLGIAKPAEQATEKTSQDLPGLLTVEDETSELPDDGTVTPVRLELGEIVSRAITPKVKVKVKPKSIVEQIDDILQKRLANSSYSNRLIRLVDAPGGGVEVLVDAKKYEGVGDVPDEEVRNLIQDCVKEWEKGK